MRERILDAAHTLLKEEGCEALSIRAIAERAGVSHMVLYTYFDNRDALLLALNQRQRARLQAHHAERLRQAEAGDIVAVMREALAHSINLSHRHPRMYRFLWVQPLHVDNHPFKQRERLEYHLQHLSHLVQLGIERSAFVERDPVVAATTAFSIVNAPLILYHSGRFVDETLREQIEVEVLEVAMNYLMQRSSPPSVPPKVGKLNVSLPPFNPPRGERS